MLTCRLIDIMADNFLLAFEDALVIQEYVQRQQSNPPTTKEVNGQLIYESRGDFGPLKKGVGQVKLCDFGSAIVLDPSKLCYREIQPDGLEAPEVLLRAGWNESADIWNMVVVVCSLQHHRESYADL